MAERNRNPPGCDRASRRARATAPVCVAAPHPL